MFSPMQRTFAILASLLLLFSARGAELPSHPRLLLRSGGEQAVRDAILSQRVTASVDSFIVAWSDKVLEEPPVKREKQGMRLLHVTRLVPQRIFYLAYTYRIHGGERYFLRAKQEMDALCEFEDWNPSHFLDAAGCALALSLGYDWFYGLFSPQDREKYARNIYEKAILPSRDTDLGWFYRSDTNWNQVCNAGLLFGALAFWEHYPDAADAILQACLETNPLVLREGYSAEGGYAEGYSYWGYGSSWQMMLFAALESVFGDSFGLMESYPGFLRSGKFMQMMTTPLGRNFCYADNSPSAPPQVALVYFAAKSGDRSFLYREIEGMKRGRFSLYAQADLLPMLVLYGAGMQLDSLPPPADRFFVCSGRTPLMLYRSGWTSERDTYLAVKAGMMASNHAHCDVGSFYFESDGVNWATDLGAQSYTPLEAAGVDLWNRFQGSTRYDVFRIGPFSHNIITVNGTRPDVLQNIPFRRVWQEPEGVKGAEMDLHMLYWEDLSACVRTVQLNGDDSVLTIRDSLRTIPDSLSLHPGKASTVRWNLTAEASVELVDSCTIVLSKGGEKRFLRAVLERGRNAGRLSGPRAAAEPATPRKPYDAPNPGVEQACFYFDVDPDEEVVFTVTLGRD